MSCGILRARASPISSEHMLLKTLVHAKHLLFIVVSGLSLGRELGKIDTLLALASSVSALEASSHLIVSNIHSWRGVEIVQEILVICELIQRMGSPIHRHVLLRHSHHCVLRKTTKIFYKLLVVFFEVLANIE